METLKQCTVEWQKKLFVGTPTLGWIRYEWAHARWGQIIPVNWATGGIDVQFHKQGEMDCLVPMGYYIDDAFNIICKAFIEGGFEWLLLIEDDVIIPQHAFIKFDQWIAKATVPAVSGLYYTKTQPPQPLMFRGRGNGPYLKWKFGDEVAVDGIPMGCLLIHGSLIKWMYDNSPEYQISSGEIVRQVIETPRKVVLGDGTTGFSLQLGTQDLYFFDRIRTNEVLKKTGWKDAARKTYPYICDTGIFCKHIDRGTGEQYPFVVPVQHLKKEILINGVPENVPVSPKNPKN